MAEGVSDEPFLRTLITRQLEGLLLAKAPGPVDVQPCEVSPVRITAAGVAKAARELALDCHLLFLHSDEKERAKADDLAAELREWAQGSKAAEPVVLVPVRMTESWMLADRKAITTAVGGADLTAYPYKQPGDVEKAHNSPDHPAYAKRVWQAIAGKGHGGALDDSMELLAQHIDLDLLGQLPSYQRWLADTEHALKLKGFL
ncbi:DUF4276 family protein [Kitasatospora sp. NA04385]|uniref:DUF4276 family protein n=1 Tax=Kitasatospora sp. NA04385 TaxID=2742135 RepID=UPI001590F198|nr:DUF4276 family protein [Kitasatospora sp. NA04385]QKW21647.1 DUF4276 family protein [Kitasatospora sp. NA04385]